MSVGFLDRAIEKIDSELNETSNNISELKKSIDIKEKTKDFMTKVLYIKKAEMNILIDIVNQGLKYTYPDEDFTFDMKFEEKNNRVIPEFYVNETKLEKGLIGVAGGVLQTISLLIYLTFLKLKRTKIVFLDEACSMIDPVATDLLFQFIDYFSIENGLIIGIITHKQLDDYDETYVTDKIKMFKLRRS